jgi:hypothetical protein
MSVKIENRLLLRVKTAIICAERFDNKSTALTVAAKIQHGRSGERRRCTRICPVTPGHTASLSKQTWRRRKASGDVVIDKQNRYKQHDKPME